MNRMNVMAKRASRMPIVPIVPIVAILFGGAVAFFCFAMPVGLVERLVLISGLPALIPATAPPLGMTAQTLFAAVAGLSTMLAVILGFAMTDGTKRIPRRMRIKTDLAESPAQSADFLSGTPRQRRADAHPDAPARWPIFAGAELGEPLDLVQPLPDDGFADADAPDAPASWKPMPRAFEQAARDAAHPSDAHQSTIDSPAVAPLVDSADEPDWATPPADADSIEEAVIVTRDESPLDAPRVVLAETAVAAQPVAPRHQPQPEGAPEAPAQPTLTELLARLEAGLIRREALTSAFSRVTPLRAPPAAPEGFAEDKLRAALDELQKMVGRRA